MYRKTKSHTAYLSCYIYLRDLCSEGQGPIAWLHKQGMNGAVISLFETFEDHGETTHLRRRRVLDSVSNGITSSFNPILPFFFLSSTCCEEMLP